MFTIGYDLNGDNVEDELRIQISLVNGKQNISYSATLRGKNPVELSEADLVNFYGFKRDKNGGMVFPARTMIDHKFLSAEPQQNSIDVGLKEVTKDEAEYNFTFKTTYPTKSQEGDSIESILKKQGGGPIAKVHCFDCYSEVNKQGKSYLVTSTYQGRMNPDFYKK